MSKDFKCQYCGKDFNNNSNPQGSLNLHEYRCKAKPENRNKVEKKENGNETRCKSCNTKLKLLSTSNDKHIPAIDKGYNFYCPNCKDVYK